MSKNAEVRPVSVTEWPFYWLTRAMVAYSDTVASALRETRLDVPAWRVVMVLADAEWLSVSEIGELANTKLAAMTKTVKRMKEEDLVETREGNEDRRVTLVALTDQGRLAAEAGMEAAARVANQAFFQFSPEEQQQLSSMLARVVKNLR